MRGGQRVEGEGGEAARAAARVGRARGVIEERMGTPGGEWVPLSS